MVPAVSSPGMRWTRICLVGFLVAFSVALCSWYSIAGRSVTAGVAAYRRGEWAAAATIAEKRLGQVKDDGAALRLWARSSARMGRHTAARAAYSRLNNSELKAEDHYLIGLGWRSTG